jgi:hypothetical protein
VVIVIQLANEQNDIYRDGDFNTHGSLYRTKAEKSESSSLVSGAPLGLKHGGGVPSVNTCRRCGSTENKFSRDVRSKSGFKTWCNPCTSERKREARREKKPLSEMVSKRAPLGPLPIDASDFEIIEHACRASEYPSRTPAVFKLYKKYNLTIDQIADCFSVSVERIKIQLDECEDILKRRDTCQAKATNRQPSHHTSERLPMTRGKEPRSIDR